MSLKLAAATCVAISVLWVVVLMSPSVDVRVESKVDTVKVLSRSGMWYHEYHVTLRRVPDSAQVRASHSMSESERERGRDSGNDGMGANEEAHAVRAPLDTHAVDRITIRASEAQYDDLRTGARLRVRRLPLFSSFAWVVDESVMEGLGRALAARMVRFQNPRSVAPSLGSASGLGRVVSVHRVNLKRGALRAGGVNSRDASLDVIVVEFWAPRIRALVRAVDAVDARSIGDLGPGQILQLHYDPRQPRVMRLDDGMRTSQP
jgi:hypothetical protein